MLLRITTNQTRRSALALPPEIIFLTIFKLCGNCTQVTASIAFSICYLLRFDDKWV